MDTTRGTRASRVSEVQKPVVESLATEGGLVGIEGLLAPMLFEFPLRLLDGVIKELIREFDCREGA